MISGQKVSIIPSVRKRMNTGIIVTCAGSIMRREHDHEQDASARGT